MPFQDLAAFMHPEFHFSSRVGAAAEPTARMLATGLFGGLQGTFCIGMRNYLRTVFGTGSAL